MKCFRTLWWFCHWSVTMLLTCYLVHALKALCKAEQELCFNLKTCNRTLFPCLMRKNIFWNYLTLYFICTSLQWKYYTPHDSYFRLFCYWVYMLKSHVNYDESLIALVATLAFDYLPVCHRIFVACWNMGSNTIANNHCDGIENLSISANVCYKHFRTNNV